MPESSGRSRRRLARGLAAAAAVLLIGWIGWRLAEVRHHRRVVAEARAEMRAGRHGHAVRILSTLPPGSPGRDEADYLLGVCEKARGRDGPAEEAWSRVPAGSPFAARAIQGLMDLKIHRGRLGDAERLVERALADPRIDAAALQVFLGMVYSLEGRVEDGRRLLEADWRRLDAAGEGASERAIQLARLHVALGLEIGSDEATRAYLDQAARQAPDDDRIWLGRAHLAIRSGALDDAARWLEACLRKRPDDVAVWRARLDWAVKAGRVEAARAALSHLPAADASPVRVRRLAAWLAAHDRQDGPEAERRALERLLELDPVDVNAVNRLACLAGTVRSSGRVEEFRRRAAEAPQLEARFGELHRRNQPIRDAAKLGRLARQLGRPFEAEAFLTLAVAADPDRTELRDELAQVVRDGRDARRPLEAPGLTLDQAVAAELTTSANWRRQSSGAFLRDDPATELAGAPGTLTRRRNSKESGPRPAVWANGQSSGRFSSIRAGPDPRRTTSRDVSGSANRSIKCDRAGRWSANGTMPPDMAAGSTREPVPGPAVASGLVSIAASSASAARAALGLGRTQIRKLVDPGPPRCHSGSTANRPSRSITAWPMLNRSRSSGKKRMRPPASGRPLWNTRPFTRPSPPRRYPGANVTIPNTQAAVSSPVPVQKRAVFMGLRPKSSESREAAGSERPRPFGKRLARGSNGHAARGTFSRPAAPPDVRSQLPGPCSACRLDSSHLVSIFSSLHRQRVTSIRDGSEPIRTSSSVVVGLLNLPGKPDPAGGEGNATLPIPHQAEPKLRPVESPCGPRGALLPTPCELGITQIRNGFPSDDSPRFHPDPIR
ncbi:MAG: tetratricopeptide repeat protein [Isosphaeraceae bacterium]